MKLIITETQLKKLKTKINLSEQNNPLPTRISGTYTANDCDELHAFQGTGGKTIGGMNEIIGDKLKELYDLGLNPIVTNIKVKVNDMSVTWVATISESIDGKAWVGFTSRGAGCNHDVINRAESSEVGNDMETARNKIQSTYNEPNISIEKVNDVIYQHPSNGFRQVFYRYTKPKSFPPHKV